MVRACGTGRQRREGEFLTIDIRQVPEADLSAYLNAVEMAGSSELTDEVWRDIRATFEPQRVLGVYDGAQIVGGGAAFSFELTVPGRRTSAPPGSPPSA